MAVEPSLEEVVLGHSFWCEAGGVAAGRVQDTRWRRWPWMALHEGKEQRNS
jgi:hypothetical protein